MSYKITGVSPEPENTVSITTTAESPEKAARSHRIGLTAA
jgi:hypothetical protein